MRREARSDLGAFWVVFELAVGESIHRHDQDRVTSRLVFESIGEEFRRYVGG